MIRLLTSEQMRFLDEKTINNHNVPSMVLMERASLSVIKHLDIFDTSRTLVVCGSGNNGGDGIAVARLLHLSGVSVDIYFAGSKNHLSEGCRNQMDIALSYGVRFVNNPVYSEYTTIVDALFGVGLNRPVSGNYETIIHNINTSGTKIMAVDIPSGVSADDGSILGCAVKADVTVTFAYTKVGHVIYPGKSYCGKVITEDIGIYYEKDVFDKNYYSLTYEDINKVPCRKANGNKGTFGKVLLFAGSKDMPGASVLCGQAIMRTGAGMLRILTPAENKQILATSVPEAILDIYESREEAKDKLIHALQWADVVTVGPGIGLSDCVKELVAFILKNCSLPLVLDADGLNIISLDTELLKNRKGSCIITPHVGEMARLTGFCVNDVSNRLVSVASTFAKEYDVQCVLKDAATCIAVPNDVVYINTSGNSGMATAGSGDVLTGMIAGLLAVGVDWKYAGALGCYIHGLCGDRVYEKNGAGYLIASDIINEISYFRLGEEKTNECL